MPITHDPRQPRSSDRGSFHLELKVKIRLGFRAMDTTLVQIGLMDCIRKASGGFEVVLNPLPALRERLAGIRHEDPFYNRLTPLVWLCRETRWSPMLGNMKT